MGMYRNFMSVLSLHAKQRNNVGCGSGTIIPVVRRGEKLFECDGMRFQGEYWYLLSRKAMDCPLRVHSVTHAVSQPNL